MSYCCLIGVSMLQCLC